MDIRIENNGQPGWPGKTNIRIEPWINIRFSSVCCLFIVIVEWPNERQPLICTFMTRIEIELLKRNPCSMVEIVSLENFCTQHRNITGINLIKICIPFTRAEIIYPLRTENLVIRMKSKLLGRLNWKFGYWNKIQGRMIHFTKWVANRLLGYFIHNVQQISPWRLHSYMRVYFATWKSELQKGPSINYAPKDLLERKLFSHHANFDECSFKITITFSIRKLIDVVYRHPHRSESDKNNISLGRDNTHAPQFPSK